MTRECAFDGCTKEPRYATKDLCGGHLQQLRTTGVLKPLAVRISLSGPCLAGECDRPRWARGYCSGHYQQHIKGQPLVPLKVWSVCALDWCERETTGETCKAHAARLRFFHITAEHLNNLFVVRQGRCCAICRSDHPGRNDWHIDHDHSCCPGRIRSCGKCVRGLLCSRCNLMLGHARDSRDTLAAAVVYLSGYPPAKGMYSQGTGNVVKLSQKA